MATIRVHSVAVLKPPRVVAVGINVGAVGA